MLEAVEALGSGWVGTCVMVRLHDFFDTPLMDTRIMTDGFNIEAHARELSLTALGRGIRSSESEAETNPTFDAARRELALLQKDPIFEMYAARFCAVCMRGQYNLSGPENRLKLCARCGVAAYCCSAHQTEHWPTHKEHCRPLRRLKRREAELQEIIASVHAVVTSVNEL